MERGGDAGDGEPLDREPLCFTTRDLVILAHRAGVALHVLRGEYPAWEARALLLDQVAQLEQRRRAAAEEDDRGPAPPINPPDQPAPSWVDDLPSDED